MQITELWDSLEITNENPKKNILAAAPSLYNSWKNYFNTTTLNYFRKNHKEQDSLPEFMVKRANKSKNPTLQNGETNSYFGNLC